MTHDVWLGPFWLNDPLPGYGRVTGYEAAMRLLAGEPLSTDPHIGVEEGGDLDVYLAEYLKIPEAEFTRAELLMKIKSKIQKRAKAVAGDKA